MRKYTGKHLLAYVREINYAHPGEEEAILNVMNNFAKYKQQKIIDVGCGLGGTANFIQKKGWGKVSGFDIESASIEYAKKTYSNIDFYTSDVESIGAMFQSEFDIVCLFTSFYAFHNQESSLLSLNKIAKNSACLAIFDYLDLCENKVNPLFRDANNASPFIPIKLNQMEKMLRKTGWQIEKSVDISDKFLIWYEQLLLKIVTKKDGLIAHFGENAYQKAYDTYKQMLDVVNNKEIGGIIVYAKKIK